MRIPFIATCMLFYFTSTSQAKKNTIDSKIEQVTVFLKGAQVHRTGTAQITAGKSEWVFANISPNIEKQSIQLSTQGNVTILSVQHQLNHLKEQEAREEIRSLEEQRNTLQDKITQEQNMIQVYRQEEAMLVKNQDIKGTQTNLKSDELRAAVDFQRQRLSEVYNRITESDKTIKKTETAIQKIQQQLASMHALRDQSTSEIIVTLLAKENTSAKFDLSYLVKQAGWYPTYDVRVKNVTSPIDLEINANITQQSGEDWKEVKLQLSSGDPEETGTKPTLNPWHLHFAQEIAGMELPKYISPQTVYGRVSDEKGAPIMGATVYITGTNIGTTTNANGFFSLQNNTGEQQLEVTYIGYEGVNTAIGRGFMNVNLNPATAKLEEVVVVGYGEAKEAKAMPTPREYLKKKIAYAINTTTIYQPTTTTYDISEKYSLPTDGKLYTVDIETVTLNADYEYYTAPKLDNNAYLTAKIIDWQELNLMTGEANLFYEGTFLGKSVIDVANAGDTLSLSLGKDKNVIITRTLLKENSLRKMLSNKKTDTRDYEISVRNNKPESIQIIIEDQFPISSTKEIEIESKEAKEGMIDLDTQKITWSQKIEAKKEQKYRLKYMVTYPKDKRLILD